MSSISTQAATWLVRLSNEDPAPSDQALAEFQDWLNADPRHRQAVERLEVLLGNLEGLPPGAARNALESYNRHDSKSVHWNDLAKVIPVLLIAILVCWHLSSTQIIRAQLAETRTGYGEWQQLTLEDGSRLHLSPNSAVDLHLDNHQRTIDLIKGELLIDVAPDPDRPLVVQTDHGHFRALGTRFTVLQQDQSSVLAVIESKVLVQTMSAGPGAGGVEIPAGYSVTLHPDRIDPAKPFFAATYEAAWHQHQLVVEGQSLAWVLDHLSRYHRAHLHFEEKALAQFPVIAVLPLDDLDRALELLAQSFPIQVQRSTPWWRSITLKP